MSVPSLHLPLPSGAAGTLVRIPVPFQQEHSSYYYSQKLFLIILLIVRNKFAVILTAETDSVPFKDEGWPRLFKGEQGNRGTEHTNNLYYT